MSDSEDALREALSKMFKHAGSARTTAVRPSGTAMSFGGPSGVHPSGVLSSQRQSGGWIGNRLWVVSMEVVTHHPRTALIIRDRCENVTEEIAPNGEFLTRFTIRRSERNAVMAMIEANDWLMTLLHRNKQGNFEPVHDCTILSVEVCTSAEYNHRNKKREELLEFQKNELSYHKSDPLYQGFGSKWDTSGFDVTDV